MMYFSTVSTIGPIYQKTKLPPSPFFAYKFYNQCSFWCKWCIISRASSSMLYFADGNGIAKTSQSFTNATNHQMVCFWIQVRRHDASTLYHSSTVSYRWWNLSQTFVKLAAMKEPIKAMLKIASNWDTARLGGLPHVFHPDMLPSTKRVDESSSHGRRSRQPKKCTSSSPYSVAWQLSTSLKTDGC